LIVLPSYKHGLVDALLGYGVVLFVTGLVIAVVFQLAHVVEDTKFPSPDNNTNKIESEWALHQINTTANFATHNKVISWFMGGLNFQVEHHLFPKISHIHYPEISKIVRDTCREFNVQYIEYPTFVSAVGAHLRHLKELGRA
jgi:linoleoyl-CoA desaturase